ncbi:MAG TPA: NADH-quinone oxidoreductase subunit C [Candidatus Binatia bacterium]|jgi:NADH-quinone oxidoreductase subunit C|nr:NADH-quinone oxidoreductase subunit C [Candidatus Binatia bacterium]
MAEMSPQLQLIQHKLGERILNVSEPQGDHVIALDRAGLRESFRLLKEDAELSFNFLSDITAVDYWNKQEPRFEVVYQLVSLKQRRRLRVRVGVPESDSMVDSLTPLWRGANFLEREVWDLYGIRFKDHPDLRRILLYDEFTGHPLRKDYPVNLCQPRVPERYVDGTFVDERSHNKLLRLQKNLAKKN